MFQKLLARVATAGLLLTAIVLTPAPAEATSVPPLDHVFVIVMENALYSEVIGNSSAPYISSLASSNGLATNYYGVSHPSLPNYLALTGASTFGIASDCTTCWVAASNIADSLEAAGRTWKAYEESMPSACFVGDSYPYMQKHDPFIYFNDIRTNTSRCQSHVVPYTQLTTDLRSTTTTPNFAFITPNMCDDMHDCSVGTGDSWLQQQVPAILNSPAFTQQHSLLAVTWDESDSSSTNQVATILAGSGIRAGFESIAADNHYSLLHTIESALGVGTLNSGTDGAATVMGDFFTSVTPSPSLGDIDTLDAYGAVAADSGPALQTTAYWPSWKIARTAHALPATSGSGLVLDGYGGLHTYGAGMTVRGAPYWGWNIARDFAFLPGGGGGYVLDGYGGIHPFAIGSNAMPPAVKGAPYWGWDIARKIVIFSDGTGGLVMDGYGGLHPFAISTNAVPAVPTGGAYWPGWQIARDVILIPGSHAGYVLDGYGGLHGFNGAPGVSGSPYWGWDIARSVWLLPGSSSSAASGYVLDGYGGAHPFGGAPAVTGAYWPGQDIARQIWGA